MKEEISKLTGPPQSLAVIWVYKTATGNAKIVYDYVMSKNVNVYNISKTSNINAKYKSFKLTVAKDNLKVILKPKFWPNGVKYKKWIGYNKIESITFYKIQYNSLNRLDN